MGIALAAFTFIKKWWTPILILVIILGVVFYWWLLKHQISSLKDTNQKLHQQNIALVVANTVYKQNTNILKVAVNSQNLAIKQWKKTSDKLESDMTNLTASLIAQQQYNQKTIEKILGSATPKSCQSAIQYLYDNIRGLKWAPKLKQ